MAKGLMIQGAGSNVGKSLLVAGLARAARLRGLSVAPFKPQNMSNNAAATASGGEIGRAQALQALAAGLEPDIHMNPVLLKPETETGAQVIVQGARMGTLRARHYGQMKASLMPKVLESFHHLAQAHELVLIEGAGSPAEVNLRAGDIANMGFAEAADIPVVMIGDIDRGGVIAQLVGTFAVLSDADRARIKGFAINKFRGDPSLFREGQDLIAMRTGWRDLGVLPYFEDAWRLPAEDVLDLKRSAVVTAPTVTQTKIAVPQLGRIANFDDLDPLCAEPGVVVEIIPPGRPLPGDAALVILPGSKATRADLEGLRAEGWDIDLRAHLRRGGHVLGICGGYQMLGKAVHDPHGIEGAPGSAQGLGLLNIETKMDPAKELGLVTAQSRASGVPVQGYEIHIGQSSGPDCARGMLLKDGQIEGAASPDGRVRGTYLHGLFASDAFRREILSQIGAPSSETNYTQSVEQALNDLAAHLEAHLDLDALFALATPIGPPR